MVIDRRGFLSGTAGLFAGSGGARARAGARIGGDGEPLDRVLYAAARRGTDGRYAAALFGRNGKDLRAVALPGRGHDATFCPTTRLCVVFARRPGTFAVAFEATTHTPPVVFGTLNERHFYGHGVFSRDGRLLYATENHFEAGQGVVGVYDVGRRFARLGEFPSHGIGPHDIALLGDGKTLVVANGGLREHPDFGGGRRVLNADRVETSLAYIEAGTGDLLERHDLPVAVGLSLRHLDVGARDTVIIGAQAPSSAEQQGSIPLVYRHRRREPVEALPLLLSPGTHLAGYVSSVAVDRAGETAAVTSSRGGIAIVLEIETGRVLRQHSVRDVSGVARAGPGGDAGFVLTSGEGTLVTETVDGLDRRGTRWQWDNHLAVG